MGIPITSIKMRGSDDRVIFIMEIPVPGKQSLNWIRNKGSLLHYPDNNKRKGICKEFTNKSNLCCIKQNKYNSKYTSSHTATCIMLFLTACNFFKYIPINTLRSEQNGLHFEDNNFKWILFNEKVWISLNISLKFVHKGPKDYKSALVQLMATPRHKAII